MDSKKEFPPGIKARSQGGNRSHSKLFKIKVFNIVRRGYPNFGNTFAAEKLSEFNVIHVSKETLRQWMIEDGLWVRKRRKDPRIHQTRDRRSRLRELVQIDCPPHDWFDGRASKCYLLAMIDDATSRLLSTHFEPSEIVCFRCFKSYLLSYGCPLAYYSDRPFIRASLA